MVTTTKEQCLSTLSQTSLLFKDWHTHLLYIAVNIILDITTKLTSVITSYVCNDLTFVFQNEEVLPSDSEDINMED